MTRAMSILSMKGYNTSDGVFGLIAMPTFIFFAFICSISSSISFLEDRAS